MKQKNSFSHFPQRRINLLFATFLSLPFFGILSAELGAKNLAALPLAQLSQTNNKSTSAANTAAADGSTNTVAKPAQSEKPLSPYDDVTVEKYQFGVVTDHSGATKDWKLHPVVVIPNLPGIQYAWKMKLNRSNPVFVREEFTLPEAPSSWKIKAGETSSQLLNGGEQCVLESFQTTDGGWIGHSWSASLGDPPGRYQIKIWLNGKLVQVFTFNVGEPASTDRQKRDI